MKRIKAGRTRRLKKPFYLLRPLAQARRLAAENLLCHTLVPAPPSPRSALRVPFFVSIPAGRRLLCQEDSALSLRQPVCGPAPPPCSADLGAPPSGPRPPSLGLLLPPAGTAIRPTTNCPSIPESSDLRARLGRGPPAAGLERPTPVCTTGRKRPRTAAVPGSAVRPGSASPDGNSGGAHPIEHLMQDPACTRSNGGVGGVATELG